MPLIAVSHTHSISLDFSLKNAKRIEQQYRGIQKSFNKNLNEGEQVDFQSVEGVLEIALKKFKPINDFKLVLSSR